MAAAAWRSRILGAALALLVQALFLSMVILAPSRPAQPMISLAHETILLLRSLPRTAPAIIDARAPAATKRHKPVPALVPVLPPSLAPSPGLPSDLVGFGQALFGCAPEHYADLTPDQRAHCPKPGEGLANKEQPDLMGGHSHAKDNARWANAMAHKQTLPMLPGGMLFPLVALRAVLDGSISEPNSAFRDPEQWPDERDPSQFMPHNLDEQERALDAWHKDHPAK